MNEKVGIVVLNYLNYHDTIECVDSILEMNYAIEGIVIVDNHSGNESFAALQKKYFKNNKIIVVCAGKNYGFAKGNNIGIQIARKRFNVDFVFVVNNDVIFTQQDYFQILLKNYSEGIGAIGSEIHLAGDKIQKKYRIYTTVKEYVVWLLIYYCKLYHKPDLVRFLPPIYSSATALHGCAVLLTPDFFKYYEGFYKRTFLYHEEHLLYFMCRKYGLKQKYVSDTYIFHKEDGSSEMSFHNSEHVKWKYAVQSGKYVVWWLMKEKICDYFTSKKPCHS